jgi:hypothetical protein
MFHIFSNSLGKPPEQVEEAQIRANRRASDDTRQNAVDTVDYGGQQMNSLQAEFGWAN